VAETTRTPIPIAGGGTVLAEQLGHTLLVTINRPEARNAVNANVTLGIGEALDYAEGQPEIRTVIITGAGDKAFCAGADLKEVAAGTASLGDPRAERWGFAGFVRHAISKPIIAAVNGFALGGGTEISLASDLIVAAESAAFGLPEVARGIFAAAGGAFRLPRQLPYKVALEAMLTGRPITAQRAYELGLVNRVVPLERLLDEAFALAELINANAPLSVQVTKRIAREITDGQFAAEDDDWARSAAEGAFLMTTHDAQEGPRAFAEKRAPQWQGK
jgi:crotonobetainyl-CoA hydratase